LNNLILVKLFAALFFTFASVFTVSAQTGKIGGRVVAEASSEPMPGVSVYVADVERGAITDADGYYTIPGVPVGNYSVRFSYVGYQTVIVEDVEVFTNQTTEIDAELTGSIVEGEEVIVQAERPIVQKDRTSSVSYLRSETIEKLPATQVSDLVRFQPGVVSTSDGGFSFRGGRTREVAYVIDGIPVQDVFSQSGGSTVNIELESVNEIQVLTGTFDAELGGAQSGVVNVNTRNPSDEFRASVLLRSGGYYPGNDDIFIDGESINPLESQDISFTASGPLIKKNERLGFFISGRYRNEAGYLKGERRFTPEDGLIFSAYRFWYRDRFNPDDTRRIPLDTATDPQGEPIVDSNGNPIEFGSGDGAIVDMNSSETISLNPKIVYRFSNRIRLNYSAIYNQSESQGFNTRKRFAPDGRLKTDSRSLTQIISLKSSFGNNMFANLRASYKFGDQKTAAFEDFDDPRYQYFSDRDPVTGFSLGGTENSRSFFDEKQWIVSGDFTWQFNNTHEFKTGFQFRNNQFKTEDRSVGWVRPDQPDRLATNVRPPNASDYDFFDQYLEATRLLELERILRKDVTGESTDFEQSPVELAAFLQDKIEFGSNIIVKLGMRYEYYDTRGEFIENTRQQAELIGREDNLREIDPKEYVSPRIGISFPISETGAFRVAYGHFTQMPAYSRMFQNPVDENTNQGRLRGTTIGNPNLRPERTVKYEMGIQQQISNFVGVDLNLYYKNVRNLLGLEILSTSDGVEYFRTINRDFGQIKGGTIALVTKPRGVLQNAGFDVTFEDAQGSSSNPNFIADVIVAGRAGEVGDVVVDRQIIPLDWNQSLTANAYATVGKSDSWNIGFIYQMATGQPYTPTFLSPDKDFPENFFDNSENKPVQITFDVTSEKEFQLMGVGATARLQINNLFNYLNERRVFSASGRANQIIRLPDVQQERSNLNEIVGLFSNETDDLRPTWYSAPRQFLFSIQIEI
jgi:outer membrane receptor for ferrienterochelin and colicin